jgi:hypothetical protein
MTEIELKVVQAWQQAAIDLGFQFTSPVTVTTPDGGCFEALGLVHQFGRRIGTLISILGEPPQQSRHLSDDSYVMSSLGTRYCNYERQLFVDTLNDWQFFGSATDRPRWYSGKTWS